MDEQVQAIEKEYQHLFSIKSDKYDQLKARMRSLRKELEAKRHRQRVIEQEQEIQW